MICIIHEQFLLRFPQERKKISNEKNYYRDFILATIRAHDIVFSEETIDGLNLDYEKPEFALRLQVVVTRKERLSLDLKHQESKWSNIKW